MELIYCIRFSLQLLAAEGAMVWGLPGRKNFGWQPAWQGILPLPC